jgi:integrase
MSPDIKKDIVQLSRRKSLTDATLKSLRPTSTRREIADGGCPNLWAVVHPTGRIAWVWRGSVCGVSDRIRLGQYPSLELRDARLRAREITQARDNGTGRPELKERFGQSARTRPTVTDDIENRDDLDHFFECYMKAEGSKKRSARLKQGSYVRDLQPHFGARPVTSITRQEIRSVVMKKAEQHPVGANRLLSLIRRVCNWLIENEHLTVNPCAGIKPPGGSEAKRARTLNADEIRWLSQALNKQPEPWRSGVGLLLLTGQRRNEVFGMAYSELELHEDAPRWIIPRGRVKNMLAHVVPLAPAAVRIIRGIGDTNGSPFLFPAQPWLRLPGQSDAKRTPSKHKAVSGFSRAQKRLVNAVQQEAEKDRPGHQVPHWTLHDLRRTVVTGLNALRIEFRVVEATVNHISGTGKAGVAGVYDTYERIHEKRDALNVAYIGQRAVPPLCTTAIIHQMHPRTARPKAA